MAYGRWQAEIVSTAINPVPSELQEIAKEKRPSGPIAIRFTKSYHLQK
jgi:hypothetical protein